MSRFFRLVFVAAVLFSAVGCHKIVATNVPGTYIAEYEGDRDELQLRPDGSYTHVLGSNSFKQVDGGKWQVETFKREALSISLENFRFREHGGGVKRPGIWIVEVEADFLSGKYKLCFDPDLYKCFVKNE